MFRPLSSNERLPSPTVPSGAASTTTLLFVNPNMTFGGATPTGETDGHNVSVQLIKSNNAISIKIIMMREGGIHFNLLGYTATGNQVICTIPEGYRPLTDTYCVGLSTNNNFWASYKLTWGGFIIETNGKIYQRSHDSGEVITTIQTNLEHINGEITYTLDNNVYTSDGII